MSEIVAGFLLVLLYSFILILMITVVYKKYKEYKIRRYKIKMKKRLKLIKGENVGK